ncbi:MAG: CHRD domain-containing protein [Thaumarchaeota archaeon]|nr:CHRD domain-containing protein [Nitrososphaerota archaeon]
MSLLSNRLKRVLGVLGFAALLYLSSVVIVPAYASSGLISCTATLSGANEVPPAVSQGTGSITFTFDPNTSTSTWSETFSGLTTPATAAHIHASAPPGSNAAVQVPFTGVPAATSGSFSGTTTTINVLTAVQFATALLAGDAYANVHTSTYPGGEIRGWLTCTQARGVPEFSLGLGTLAVAAMLAPVLLALRRAQVHPQIS